MSRVREVIVVHDAACGGCAGVAARLGGVLRRPVLLRSCRDPELARAHPVLRDVGCRPALGLRRADGSVSWWVGRRAALGALPVLRWSAPRGAVRVLGDVWRLRRGAARR